MGLLTKLKSLLGLEDDRSQVRRGESGVTIEREPDESVEPDSETESAVKGVDTDTEESEDATESSGLHKVEEAEPVETDATESEDTAETGVSTEDVTTEPGEATEPTTDADEADQTAADEADAEMTPEETVEESGAEEAETTEEPVGEGEPLEDVKGIGSAYAERLRDAGVANVAELAKADADRLAEETGLSEKRISSWIDRAQAR